MTGGSREYDITSSCVMNIILRLNVRRLFTLGVGGHQCSSQLVLHLQNISFGIFQGRILSHKLAGMSLVIMIW